MQGKQSIADHVCSRMFVDLNTDALHLKTDGRGWGRDTIGYPLPFFPERYLDNFLLLSGSVRRFRYLTGFFTQSPDMVVKCADGDPVLYTPLTVGKPAGSAEYSGRFYTPIPEIGNHRSDMKETAIPF